MSISFEDIILSHLLLLIFQGIECVLFFFNLFITESHSVGIFSTTSTAQSRFHYEMRPGSSGLYVVVSSQLIKSQITSLKSVSVSTSILVLHLCKPREGKSRDLWKGMQRMNVKFMSRILLYAVPSFTRSSCFFHLSISVN